MDYIPTVMVMYVAVQSIIVKHRRNILDSKDSYLAKRKVLAIAIRQG
jgi:hypothetical protein